jgi:hypothetical protein
MEAQGTLDMRIQNPDHFTKKSAIVSKQQST